MAKVVDSTVVVAVKPVNTDEVDVDGEMQEVDLNSSLDAKDLKEGGDASGGTKDNKDKKNNKKKKKKKEEEDGPKVPFKQLYKYATCEDYILMVIGAICGLGTGVLMPLMLIVFGDMFDVMSGQMSDPKAMMVKSVTFLLILMGAIICTAYLQGACFGVVGERQVDRMRNHFFSNLLRQEIGWFDTANPLQMTERLAQDTILIQAAMSEKFGMLFQFAGMFCGGFAVGFIYNWKISLIILAVSPLLAISGGLMMVLMENITSQSQAHYAKAGEQAAEALSQTATIQSFKGEDAICQSYESSLKESQKQEAKKGIVTGLGFGFFIFTMFSSYAPAFMYGGEVVAHDWDQALIKHPNSCGFPAINLDDSENLASMMSSCPEDSVGTGAGGASGTEGAGGGLGALTCTDAMAALYREPVATPIYRNDAEITSSLPLQQYLQNAGVTPAQLSVNNASLDVLRTMVSTGARRCPMADTTTLPLYASQNGLAQLSHCMMKAICNGHDPATCSYGCYIPAFLDTQGTKPNPDAPKCATVGSILIAFFSILTGAMAFGQATPSLQALASGRGAAHKIFEVINRKSVIDPDDPAGAKPAEGAYVPRIELKDVSFRFPARKEVQVLKGTNLVIEAGTTVAIVGPSGCGKSTVLQLVQRFYDPESGHVQLGGKDLHEYNLQWLRQQVGVVEQEPTLFDATIEENIGFGILGRQATKDEVVAAAKSSNAHNFIMEFPDKYATKCGEGGAQLSGGQKQRIAIARAIIKDPKILLLDEATSALDTESEKIVQAALDGLVKDKARTTIVIAHRLSTIRNADKIIVLNNADGSGAQVVEEGNHDYLMGVEGGVYRNLVNLQVGAKDGGEGAGGAGAGAGAGAAGEEGKQQQQQQQQEEAESKDDATPGTPQLARAESASSAADLDDLLKSPRNEEHAARKKQKMKKQVSADAVLDQAKQMQSEVDKEELQNLYKVPFTKVWSLDSGNGPLYALGTVMSCVQGLIFPVYGIILSRAIKAFYQSDPAKIRQDTIFWGGMFFVIAAVGGGTLIPQFWAFSKAAGRLASRVRSKLLRALLRQDQAFFDHPDNNTGRLTWSLAEDATLIKAATGESLMLQTQNNAGLLFGLVYAFVMSWRFALVALGGVFPLMISGALQMKVFMGAQKETEEAHNHIGHVLHESVNACRTVTAFNLQPQIFAQYRRLKEHPHKVAIRTANWGGFLNGISQACMFGFIALVFWWQTELMTWCGLNEDPTRLIEAMMVLMMAAMGAGQNSALATDTGKAKAALSRVFRILDRTPTIDPWSEEGKKVPDDKFEGRISFEHVKFHYPQRPDMPVFCDLNFEVEPGTTVALVGPSGGGKSTVMQLLERFYDVCAPGEKHQLFQPQAGAKADKTKQNKKKNNSSDNKGKGAGAGDLETGDAAAADAAAADAGRVKIDGNDVRDLNVAWLRKTIGMVGQEPVLFRDTIANNVRYGKPGASDAEVQAACQQTNADGFINEFPRKYQTAVGGGAGAMGLSGGQKQRIAIARAIIKDPKILLLDEATSALDTESEKIVQTALDELVEKSKRTTLIIAHRLSTVRNVDKIIVLCPTLDDRVSRRGKEE